MSRKQVMFMEFKEIDGLRIAFRANEGGGASGKKNAVFLYTVQRAIIRSGKTSMPIWMAN